LIEQGTSARQAAQGRRTWPGALAGEDRLGSSATNQFALALRRSS